MKKIAISLLLLTFAFTPCLWAKGDVDTLWENARSDVYGTKVGGMLGRGLLNAATCFVDVIVHTVEGSKQGPAIVGSLTGLGSGIACTALRATSGALDLATFWVPGFNGFPVSRSYSNCLEMEEGEEFEVKPQELGPAPEEAPAPEPVRPSPEDYAKPAAPAKHDAMDYVKK